MLRPAALRQHHALRTGEDHAAGGQVGERADIFGDVFAEGADVGAFAATYVDDGFGRVKLGNIDGVNGDVTAAMGFPSGWASNELWSI